MANFDSKPGPAGDPFRPAVLVTGASGGIGRAISQTFGQAGWYVGVHYCMNKTRAEDTLKHVVQVKGVGDVYQADIRIAESVQRMVQQFSRRPFTSAAMICNAGVGTGSLMLRQREKTWADIIETNLTGTFHCLRAMAPVFIERGGGAIIVVGSYAGFHGATGQAAYAASKAGLVGLVKTAAQEWGPYNIRVNLVLPGWHQTGLSGVAVPEAEGWKDHALHRAPSRAEVSRTVLHLAELEDVSGQIWNCDSRNL